MFAWSREWTTHLPLRKALSTFNFQLSTFEAVYLALY